MTFQLLLRLMSRTGDIPVSRLRIATYMSCVVACLLGSAAAQPFFNSLNPDSTGSIGLSEMQHSFDEWAKGRDLQEVKGWKHFQRFRWWAEQRTHTDGDLLPAQDWLAEAQRYERQQGRYSSRAPGWSPVGPLTQPLVRHGQMGIGQGRINSVTFHPRDPDALWVGTSNGGVWYSSNNGQSWQPQNDGLPVLRISDMAVNPQNAQELYAALGDFGHVMFYPTIRNGRFNNYGMGVYKSTDGGNSWVPTGLSYAQSKADAGLLCRILVHPLNPDRLIAAGVEGAWTSSDGGQTWKRTYSKFLWDLEPDPNRPNVVYAAQGHLINQQIGEAAILKSTDFGETWAALNTGIPPQQVVSRIKLAISPSDTNYVYAVAGGADEGLHAIYRSTDAGNTWEVRYRGADRNLLGWQGGTPGVDVGGQASYDLTLIVDAQNPEKILVGGVNQWGSEDGGKTWEIVSHWRYKRGQSLHADQHDVRYNPLNGHYYFCHDGGIDRAASIPLGNTDSLLQCFDPLWGTISSACYRLPMPVENITNGIGNTEFYRIGVGRRSARILAGSQDNGVFLKEFNWSNVFGGDGMECMIDHQNPNIFYVSNFNGNMHRTQDGGNLFDLSITDSLTTLQVGEWVTPFEMHPTDPRIIYAGIGNLWKSENRGRNWERISAFPIVGAGGIRQGIRAFRINPKDPNNIYLIQRPYLNQFVPGRAHVTFDGGQTWRNISFGLPLDSLFVTDIEIGRDPTTAWVSFAGFSGGVKIFRTDDAGKSWKNVSDGLPNLSVNTLRHQQYPLTNIIYAGTDLGIYYTSDSTQGWKPYARDFPKAIVSELEIHEASQKLYAATYGRGVWVTDLVSNQLQVSNEPGLHQASIAFFPNPSDGKLSLRAEQMPEGKFLLEVVDLMGRVVEKATGNVAGNTFEQEYTWNLLPGHYFIRLHVGSQMVSRKIVIQ
ncbi:MAG: T9SS type A sorting domain-containing protein [Bacteroidota bacterium]